MTVANTLAYYMSVIMTIKSFLVQAPNELVFDTQKLKI